jgi:eukaryotic-like serine/threonine-protein kinase
MTPERWRLVNEIFHEADGLAPDERGAFLGMACAGDAELRREVEELLGSLGETRGNKLFSTIIAEEAESLLDDGGGEAAALDRRVGSYRLTELIGRGGMAEVYRAVRDDDEFQQEVAVKLVRGGMLSSFMLSRFRHERQILASLEHPNIARLFDGGTTEDGQPYFVMELIEGRPVNEYCEQERLTVRARLELFRKVCAAVQHAHSNLVVHRDLKPSNILVTKDGAPKLLDFGIAKLLNPKTSQAATTVAQTLPAVRLMTPDYASPEQVRGDPVTTATDVYSLGAVLYELLTGEKPHRFKDHTLAEIERVICEGEVARPSEAAARRPGAPPRLRRELAGDLDNIVLTAMRKEPERRYASAEQLSEDVRRHLEGRPVRARQDTLGYRAGKFVRRHRAGVAAASAAVVLLVAFAAMMTAQAARVARERDRANALAGFLVRLFEVSDPGEARGNSITARELLDRGAVRIRNELRDQPEGQAALLDTMGSVYRKLGLYDSALPLAEEALRVRREVYGGLHPEVAESLSHLAEVYHARGDFKAAEPLYREALDMRRRLFGGEHADVAASLNALGLFLKDKGEYPEAEALLREALDTRRRLFGVEHPAVAESLNELGVLLKKRGDFKAAEPLYREALTIRARTLGEDHPAVAETTNNLATLLDSAERYAEAEPLARQALALYRRVLGPEHPHVAVSLSNLGGLLKRRGDMDGAEAHYREALAMMRKLNGAEHPEVAIAINNLGSLMRDRGDYGEAERLFREALDMRRRVLPPSHPSMATGLQNLASTLILKGDARSAEPLLREAVEVAARAYTPDHWMVSETRSAYGACLSKLGRRREAEEHLLAALAGLKAALGEENARTRKAAAALAELRARQK